MPSIVAVRIRYLIIGLVAGALAGPLSHVEAGWSETQLRVYRGIRVVFPVHYRSARRVGYCESRFDPWARNGEYHGVFQLSAYYRRKYHVLDGHWWQGLRAAHAIYRAEGWGPWECRP